MRATQTHGFDRYQLDDRLVPHLPSIGFRKPTEVQHRVMPLFMQRKSMIVEAGTGTGKTAAYALPLLSRVDFLRKQTEALILVPTRELAEQVERAFRQFLPAGFPARIGALYGGGSQGSAMEVIRKEPHILIAVPGRLKDALREGNLDHFWRDVKYLVLDEADRLLEAGFQAETLSLVRNVRKTAQVAVFSATLPTDIENLVREQFEQVTVLRLDPRDVLQNIDFYQVEPSSPNRQHTLTSLVAAENIVQALIFCNKRDELQQLTRFLQRYLPNVQAYHGLMDQQERDSVMEGFRKGRIQYLVATDLAARGLDVPNLECVINYTIPDEKDVYTHRCGRTGRAGSEGKVYNIAIGTEEKIWLASFHKAWKLPYRTLSLLVEGKMAAKDAAQEHVKVRITRGKDDKVSRKDVLGFITGQFNLSADQVGLITIYDRYSTVDFPESALKESEGKTLTIKGKSVKVEKITSADEASRVAAIKRRTENSSVRKQRKLRKGDNKH